MSWPGFYALSSAWLFLLIGPLVLFYFLKLKRPRLAVPSLVLWQQVLRDDRVNSPFQKFKRNILLLLQLLLLILLVLAAMQPYFRGEGGGLERVLVMIDRSASMGALDEPGGRSRLDEAKSRVRTLIEGLNPDQELCLITFANDARQVAPFTSNKRILLEALDEIEQRDVGSDLREALRMADAVARHESFDHVLLLSDGNFPTQVDFELPFELDYQKLPPAGPNIGITALTAQRDVGGEWAVFVKVQASAGARIPATLELIQDGQSRGTERVVVTSEEGQRLTFKITAAQRTSLELVLQPQSFDSLPADNRAFLVLEPARPLKVYVAPSLASYQHAMEALDGIELYPGYPGGGGVVPPSAYDLIISDNLREPAADFGTALYVGVTPDELSAAIESAVEGNIVIDWRRTSPLLEHVELSEVILMDAPKLAEGVGEEDLENAHYEVIAYGRTGPLVLQRRDGARTAYYLLFHTDRSTLPYRVGFPIMVSNVVRQAMHQAGLLEVQGGRTGVLAAQKLLPGAEYQISGPYAYRRADSADAQGVLSGVPAPRVGRYVFKRDGEEKALAGASLLDSQETMLDGVESIALNELSVTAAEAPSRVNRAIWSVLATIGLFVLLLEWWFYQRRPGGYNS